MSVDSCAPSCVAPGQSSLNALCLSRRDAQYTSDFLKTGEGNVDYGSTAHLFLTLDFAVGNCKYLLDQLQAVVTPRLFTLPRMNSMMESIGVPG